LNPEPPSDWPEPRPFPKEAPPPPLPLEALPEWLAAWVRVQAVAKQVAEDLFAVLGLGVLSTAAMRKFVVSPWPDWRETVNLFCVVVLPVGEGKSPAFKAAMAPVTDYESRRREEEAEELGKLVEAHRLAEERLAKTRSKLAQCTKDKERPSLKAAYDAACVEHEKLPPLRSAFLLFADDVTPEALEKTLASIGERLAIVSPEGGPFAILEGRYSDKVPNLDLFLKCHRGEAHRTLRIGRTGADLVHPLMTLVVTVQPSFLAEMLGNAAFAGRGVLGRCWIVRPQSLVGFRNHRAAAALDVSEVDTEYRRRVEELLDGGRDVSDLSDKKPEGATVFVDADAVEDWLAWTMATEKRLRPSGDLADLPDWANKVRGGALRLAGILHFAKHRGDLRAAIADPIGVETMRAALALADYFTAHAQRAFDGAGEVERFNQARAAWTWIQRKNLCEVTPRVLQRANGRRFRKVEEVREALDTLAEHGYIRRKSSTLDDYLVHPKVAGPFPPETSDKSDRRPPEVHRGPTVSDKSDASDADRTPGREDVSNKSDRFGDSRRNDPPLRSLGGAS